MFTSVDLSNAIKRDGTFISNKLVSKWLHQSTPNNPLLKDYSIEPIDVLQGTRKATLYLPCWHAATDYDNRDQVTLTPADVDAINKAKGVPTPVTVVSPSTLPSNTAKIANGYVKVITSKDRIKIPGKVIRMLGWKPGDVIDATCIETPKPLPSRLVVNADYRVSVPRRAVVDGTDPVKIVFENNKIILEKA